MHFIHVYGLIVSCRFAPINHLRSADLWTWNLLSWVSQSYHDVQVLVQFMYLTWSCDNAVHHVVTLHVLMNWYMNLWFAYMFYWSNCKFSSTYTDDDVVAGREFCLCRIAPGTSILLCNITIPYGQPGTCFTGPPIPPAIYQTGLKDTAIVWPGNVTRYGMHFVASSGGSFPFDPTVGPGYVWHCHILDHEDNDMMRPYKLHNWSLIWII